MRERRCGSSGHEVTLRGGSLLGGQWAGYDLLQRLGVRYFHPEATLYPSALEWPETRIDVREGLAYFRRSMHAHRTHPFAFPKGSLQVEEPRGAGIVESLLPGFVIGIGDDGQPFMAVGRVDGDETVSARGSIAQRTRSNLSSGPADMPVTLNNVGDLTVFGAVITVGEGTGPDARTLVVNGEMSTDEIPSD